MEQSDCPLCRNKNRLIAVIVVLFLLALLWALYETRRITPAEATSAEAVDALAGAPDTAVFEVQRVNAPQAGKNTRK